MRYTAFNRLAFSFCFPVLTPFGAGTENPRVVGSIPTLGTTFPEEMGVHSVSSVSQMGPFLCRLLQMRYSRLDAFQGSF